MGFRSVPHVEPASIPEYDLPESTIGDMSMIPNLPLYPRHDLGYTNNSRPLMQPHVSRRGPSNLHRSGDQFMNAPQIMQQWNPPIANSLDPLEPFVSFRHQLLCKLYSTLFTVPKCSGEEFGGL